MHDQKLVADYLRKCFVSVDGLWFMKVEEDADFEKNKRMIQSRIDKIDSGKAKFYTIEEVDAILEETISKYEN